ncbi:MAG: fused DSP-PTPase phosphatase/NAD kinase-like protein [bacterium]
MSESQNTPHHLRIDQPHGSPGRRARLKIIAPAVFLVALVGTGVGLGLNHVSETVIWDRFDTVKPGLLYRSGQLSPAQLQEAITTYGIKTLVNFQVGQNAIAEEAEIARKMGVAFLNLPMPGDGFGEAGQFRELMKTLDNPDRQPVLMHCARGTCRTGAAVAFYRFARDGWTIDDVSAEMQRQSYPLGWITGYIYGMQEKSPNSEIRDASENPLPPIQLPKTEPAAVVSQSEKATAEVTR